MMVRVIYKDQTAGVVESHNLDSLVRKGRIVAYHSAGRWISVEAKMRRSDAEHDDIKRSPDAMRMHSVH